MWGCRMEFPVGSKLPPRALTGCRMGDVGGPKLPLDMREVGGEAGALPPGPSIRPEAGPSVRPEALPPSSPRILGAIDRQDLPPPPPPSWMAMLSPPASSSMLTTPSRPLPPARWRAVSPSSFFAAAPPSWMAMLTPPASTAWTGLWVEGLGCRV